MSRAGRTAWGLLAGAVVLIAALAPSWTDAGFVSTESTVLSASAGTVAPAVTTCVANSGSPNDLTLAPGLDGLPVTGYRVTQTLDADLPSGWSWQTGERDGVTLSPLGDSYWTTATTALKFGIELPFLAGGSSTGTVTVRALGPGGWESDPVTYHWSIAADWGVTTVSCTPAG